MFMSGKGIATGSYEYHLLNLLPYISIIVLALLGLHVILVLTIGIGLGVVIGLMNGSLK